MSGQSNLPKGSSTIRGASDVLRMNSLSGTQAQQANRLYMLNVRRASLVNKKNATEARLNETIAQLRGIEEQMRQTEKKYMVFRKESPRRRGNKQELAEENGNGRGNRVMALRY